MSRLRAQRARQLWAMAALLAGACALAALAPAAAALGLADVIIWDPIRQVWVDAKTRGVVTVSSNSVTQPTGVNPSAFLQQGTTRPQVPSAKDLFPLVIPDLDWWKTCDKNTSDVLTMMTTKCDLFKDVVNCQQLADMGYLPQGVQSFVPSSLNGGFTVPNGCSTGNLGIEYNGLRMTFNSPQVPIMAVIAKDVLSKVYYYGSGVTQGKLLNILMMKAEFCYAPPSMSPLYVSKTSTYSTGMQPGSASWNFFKTVALSPPYTNNIASMFRGDVADATWTLEVHKTGSDTVYQGAVTGQITVTNPQPVPVTVYNINDYVQGGPTSTVSCGGALPFQIPPCSSTVCNYVGYWPLAPAAGTYTNLADVSYSVGDTASVGNQVGTAAFQVGAIAPQVAVINAPGGQQIPDGQAIVADPMAPQAYFFGTSTRQSYVTQLTCPETGIITNQATLTAATGQTVSQAATVQKLCFDLQVRVAQTAAPFVGRWGWSVTKTSDVRSVQLKPSATLFDKYARARVDLAVASGQDPSAALSMVTGGSNTSSLTAAALEGSMTGDVTYTVTFTKDAPGGVVAGAPAFQAVGDVYVTNPAPLAATLKEVTVTVSNPFGGLAYTTTATCPSLTVEAGATLQCRYVATPTFNPVGAQVAATAHYVNQRNGQATGKTTPFSSAATTMGAGRTTGASAAAPAATAAGNGTAARFGVASHSFVGRRRRLLALENVAANAAALAEALKGLATPNLTNLAAAGKNATAGINVTQIAAAVQALHKLAPAFNLTVGDQPVLGGGAAAPTTIDANGTAVPMTKSAAALQGLGKLLNGLAAVMEQPEQKLNAASQAININSKADQAVSSAGSAATTALQAVTNAASAISSALSKSAPKLSIEEEVKIVAPDGSEVPQGEPQAAAADASNDETAALVAAAVAAGISLDDIAAAAANAASAAQVAVAAAEAAQQPTAPVQALQGLQDECVEVSDVFAAGEGFTTGNVVAGTLPSGKVCESTTFTYTVRYGPYDSCFERKAVNKAAWAVPETGAGGAASAKVDVKVAGCGSPVTATAKSYAVWAKKSYAWAVTKTVSPAALTVAAGTTATATYTISYQRKDILVDPKLSATVQFDNLQLGADAALSALSYTITSQCPAGTKTKTGTFSCPELSLKAGGEPVACKIKADLPCAGPGTLVAHAASGGKVIRSAPFSFPAPEATDVASDSECAIVVDSFTMNAAGLVSGAVSGGVQPYGKLCGTKEFRYTATFGPYDTCAKRKAINTAFLRTGAPTTSAQAAATLLVDVQGCDVYTPMVAPPTNNTTTYAAPRAAQAPPAANLTTKEFKLLDKGATVTGDAATKCVSSVAFWKSCLQSGQYVGKCGVVLKLPGGPHTAFFPQPNERGARTYMSVMSSGSSGSMGTDLWLKAAQALMAAQLNELAGVTLPAPVRDAVGATSKAVGSSSAQPPMLDVALPGLPNAISLLEDFSNGKAGVAQCPQQ